MERKACRLLGVFSGFLSFLYIQGQLVMKGALENSVFGSSWERIPVKYCSDVVDILIDMCCFHFRYSKEYNEYKRQLLEYEDAQRRLVIHTVIVCLSGMRTYVKQSITTLFIWNSHLASKDFFQESLGAFWMSSLNLGRVSSKVGRASVSLLTGAPCLAFQIVLFICIRHWLHLFTVCCIIYLPFSGVKRDQWQESYGKIGINTYTV